MPFSITGAYVQGTNNKGVIAWVSVRCSLHLVAMKPRWDAIFTLHAILNEFAFSGWLFVSQFGRRNFHGKEFRQTILILKKMQIVQI